LRFRDDLGKGQFPAGGPTRNEMTFETTEDAYTISDDPTRFDLARAHAWISTGSYWGEGIPFATFAKSCANSLTLGVYRNDDDMIAMARVVTDRATFGWLCDVFVDDACRGLGLGKRIMAYFKAHPDLQGFRRMHLATRDAHGLYEQFGFGPLTAADRWMEIRDLDVYRR
jgi:GNAT superfamily N-acetyltransferase